MIICMCLQCCFALLCKQLLPLKTLAFQNCALYLIYIYVILYSIIKSGKTSGNCMIFTDKIKFRKTNNCAITGD